MFIPAGPSSFAQGQGVRSVRGAEGHAPVLWLIKHMPLTQAFGKLCARIKINPGGKKKKEEVTPFELIYASKSEQAEPRFTKSFGLFILFSEYLHSLNGEWQRAS